MTLTLDQALLIGAVVALLIGASRWWRKRKKDREDREMLRMVNDGKAHAKGPH